jgi:L-threonylcarbamoyladenylate synthase
MVSFENDIRNSIDVFQNSGVILYPTDTIWGIGCDATDEAAVEKIYHLKKRPEKKSMIILVAEEKQIFDYVTDPDNKIFQYLSSAEKPTTVIYQQAKNLANNLISDDGTIAIRIVEDPFCKTLIRGLKKPIVSTSANISGEPFPKTFNEISTAIKNGVDYIVQHRRDDLMSSQPSSIIKLNNEGTIEIIRS